MGDLVFTTSSRTDKRDVLTAQLSKNLHPDTATQLSCILAKEGRVLLSLDLYASGHQDKLGIFFCLIEVSCGDTKYDFHKNDVPLLAEDLVNDGHFDELIKELKAMQSKILGELRSHIEGVEVRLRRSIESLPQARYFSISDAVTRRIVAIGKAASLRQMQKISKHCQYGPVNYFISEIQADTFELLAPDIHILPGA